MASQIRLRHGTAAQWTSANTVLAEGEIGVETDTSKFKIGDGTTAWNSLAYPQPVSTAIDIEAIQKGGIVVGSSSGNASILPVGTDGKVLGVSTSDTTTVGWVDAPTLDSFTEVIVPTPADGDILTYNGTNWVNATPLDVITTHRDTLASLVWGESAGYFNRGIYEFDTIYRVSFPTDTLSTTNPAPGALSHNSGFSNPQVAGYFNRGEGNYSASSIIYKFFFVTNTSTTTTSAPDNVRQNAGFSNGVTAGYFSRSGVSSAVYKWVFPPDIAIATTSSTLSFNSFHGGFSNPSVAGYFSQSNGNTAVVKYAFPSDTVSTTTAAPASMVNNAGFSNPSVAGYFSRGNSADVYKLTFPSDTMSTTTSSLIPMAYHAGMANTAVAGYFSGEGLGSSPVPLLLKWSFPSDAVSIRSAFPATAYYHGAFSNGY